MRRVWGVALLGLLFVSAAADAQRNRGRGGGFGRCSLGTFDGPYFVNPYHEGNPSYNGRFIFARLWYSGDFSCGDEGPGWSHDYPIAESNFMEIVRSLTIVKPSMDRFVIVRLDDPELFKYPILYLSEPGGWDMTEKEVAGLRAYLLKGGFLIVDDFPRQAMANFVYQMKRVLPDRDVMQLPMNHAIFDSFFYITEPWNSGNQGARPEFFAIFEDNDPDRRVMCMLNFDNDLGENWQYSASGFVPVDVSNESFKLGINYYIYGMIR